MVVHALRARRAWSRAGSWGRRSAAGSRTRSGARASGWWSRPTSRIARCSSLSVEIALLDERRARPPRDASRSLARAARASSASSWHGAHRGRRVGSRPSCSRCASGPRSSPTTCASLELDGRAARASTGAGTRCALRGPGRAQRAQRRRRARGRAPRRRRRRRARSRALAGFARRRPALSAARRERRAARWCTTTTPTTRPRSRRRCGAARTLAHRRLVAVFQPHLYSRTALLAREFGAALALADVVVVLDVYPARERAEDHPGRERAADRRGEPPTRPRAGRCTGCRRFADAERGAARACCARATCAW